MRIRNNLPDGPIPKPEITKYSMKQRNKRGSIGRHGVNKHNKHKLVPLYEASPHTVWVRDDIWYAAKILQKTEDVSMRSIVEQSMYEFLIERNKLNQENDKGRRPEWDED
jgi:hypothetical protein